MSRQRGFCQPSDDLQGQSVGRILVSALQEYYTDYDVIQAAMARMLARMDSMVLDVLRVSSAEALDEVMLVRRFHALSRAKVIEEERRSTAAFDERFACILSAGGKSEPKRQASRRCERSPTPHRGSVRKKTDAGEYLERFHERHASSQPRFVPKRARLVSTSAHKPTCNDMKDICFATPAPPEPQQKLPDPRETMNPIERLDEHFVPKDQAPETICLSDDEPAKLVTRQLSKPLPPRRALSLADKQAARIKPPWGNQLPRADLSSLNSAPQS